MSHSGERMLELLALLQVRHRWSGRDLADSLGVSERTVRRDVERLRGLGYPVHADRGVDGGYQLGTGTRLPPLLVNDEEAVAIAIGLQTAASQPISGIAESSMGALVKVGQILPPRLQARVESITSVVDAPPSLSVRAVDMPTLTDLARATRDSVHVRFSYRRADGDQRDRHVQPHHVVPLDRRWYLIAWDVDRGDWRTFRLDRIEDVLTTSRGFERRPIPSGDPVSYLRDAIGSLRSVHDVAMVVEAPADEVLPLLGQWGSATALTKNTTRIEMSIPDPGWAVLLIALLDSEVQSVEPPEFAGYLEALAARLMAVG